MENIIGTVKRVFNEEGYGVISVPSRPDVHFKLADTYKNRPIRAGDRVEFDAREGGSGPLKAHRVLQLAATESQRLQSKQTATTSHAKPYFGKPTYVKVPSDRTSGVAVGLLVGSVLGPVGAVIGAIVGASSTGESSNVLTAACLRCGGTGHVTALTPTHIGFQCEQCKSFWKTRNKDGLKIHHIEE